MQPAVRGVTHHSAHDGCVLALDRDDEWYNIPSVVRQWLRHVTAENEAQRHQLAELQARQKEERDSLREWSEHVTQRDKEVALKLQSIDAFVGRTKHDADTGADSVRHLTENCLQQIASLREEVAGLKRKDLSLHTELYKVVDEATERSLSDAKARWATMESSLFRAVDAVKSMTEERLSAHSRATSEELAAANEKVRLLAEEATSNKAANSQVLGATKKGLVDELVALSNRLTSLDRIVDGHEKCVTALTNKAEPLTKLLEDEFTQLPRRFAQMEEATRLSLRDLEMRLQEVKDEHIGKIVSIGRDLETVEIKQIGRVETLRKELSNDVEDLREATVRFTTQQTIYNTTFTQKIEQTERYVGIAGPGGLKTGQAGGTSSHNISGTGVVSASTSTTLFDSPLPAMRPQPSANQTPNRTLMATLSSGIDGSPLEELVRRIASSVFAPSVLALEGKLDQVEESVAQSRNDARRDIDGVKQQTLEFCQRSVFESLSGIRADVASSNNLISVDLSSIRTRLEQCIVATETDRSVIARLVADGQAQATAVADQLKRIDARVADCVKLEVFHKEIGAAARADTDLRLRDLRVDIAEQLNRLRLDVDAQISQLAEKQVRLRQDLVGLFEEREAAAADASRLSKHSLAQTVDALVADSSRRSVETALNLTSEKIAQMNDSLTDMLRIRCREVGDAVLEQCKTQLSARALVVDNALDVVQHDMRGLRTQIDAVNTVVGSRDETLTKLVRSSNGTGDQIQAQLVPIREELSSLRLLVHTVQTDVAVVIAKGGLVPPIAAEGTTPNRKASRHNLVLPPQVELPGIAATPRSGYTAVEEIASDSRQVSTTKPAQFDEGPVALDFSSVSAVSPHNAQSRFNAAIATANGNIDKRDAPKVFMTDGEGFSEQARRLRQDVNDIISRIQNMDLVLREIEIVFTEKVEDLAAAVYTKAQIDERFETHWHGIVTLLSRKEDQTTIDTKLDAAIRQCGADARLVIREALQKIQTDLEGKMTMGDMTVLFGARNISAT